MPQNVAVVATTSNTFMTVVPTWPAFRGTPGQHTVHKVAISRAHHDGGLGALLRFPSRK